MISMRIRLWVLAFICNVIVATCMTFNMSAESKYALQLAGADVGAGTMQHGNQLKLGFKHNESAAFATPPREVVNPPPARSGSIQDHSSTSQADMPLLIDPTLTAPTCENGVVVPLTGAVNHCRAMSYSDCGCSTKLIGLQIGLACFRMVMTPTRSALLVPG